jgi:thymidylate kinase
MAIIVSFSGIDGAGKSTQISVLENWLAAAGLRTACFTFWDDIVPGARVREFISHRIFRGEKGAGMPEKPIRRRDKNVGSWCLILLRLWIYFTDAMSLRAKMPVIQRSNADVIIFDRYIYDELANLPLNWRWARAFARMIVKLIPKPDVAFVIDANPDAAFARKPEYPLEFLQCNRKSYLLLARLAQATVIESLTVEATSRRIREELLEKLQEKEEMYLSLLALQ